MKQTFPYVYLVPASQGWADTVRATFIVLASQKPIDVDALKQLDGGDGVRNIADWLLSEDQLVEILAREPQIVLTDDYVPVDNLLAPMFEASEAGK
jgi:hypothetical protein